MNRLREVVAVVDQFKAQMKAAAAQEDAANAFDFKAFVQTFTQLQRNYHEEYELYGLGALAVAAVAPIVKRRLADWRPLEEPARDYELFRSWRDLLQTGSVAGAVSALSSAGPGVKG